MSKKEKLIKRFLTVPNDFTWDETVKILAGQGYTPLKTGKTGGSRRKFSNDDGEIISLHKPHPGSIVKAYAVRQVIEKLGL